MKSTSRLIPVVAALGLALAGCGSTIGLTLDDYSKDNLDQLVVKVPADQPTLSADERTAIEPQLELIRAKFILSVFAWYASDRIRKFSGELAEGDADKVLGRVVRAQAELNKAATVILDDAKRAEVYLYMPEFNRVRYGAFLVDVAVASIEPAKRYYRSLVLPIITSPSSLSAIAAAKTVIQVIKSITEIKSYWGALKFDINTFVERAQGDMKAALPRSSEFALVQEKYFGAMDRFFLNACGRLAKLAGRQMTIQAGTITYAVCKNARTPL